MATNEQSALGSLISLAAYSIIGAFIFLFFMPVCSLMIILSWVVGFPAILAYDRRHWDKPGPDTLGVKVSSRTRKLDMGEYEVKGLVMGTCVKARNIFSAARAEARSLVGGEARQFTGLVNESRNIALTRMCQKALDMGCDTVIGFRMVSAESLWGATEIIAFGTAVRVR